jgi:uncharacterized protein
MNKSTYRSWRFQHPDFDAGSSPPGLQVSPTGGIATVEGRAAVRQAILLLLSTAPGERVMRPEYGCSLNRLVFSPNDQTTAGLAIHYVQQAITRWEPRVEILTLDAGSCAADAGMLLIKLHYRVKAVQFDDEMEFALNLNGE